MKIWLEHTISKDKFLLNNKKVVNKKLLAELWKSTLFLETFRPNQIFIRSTPLIQQFVPNIWLFLVPRGSDSFPR